MSIKSTINEKRENIKKLFTGDTASSINQVRPKMNTIAVVKDFMNGLYLDRISRLFQFVKSRLCTPLYLKITWNRPECELIWPGKRMMIRKYPALFHYIIHLDLENDLNEIIKVTSHQDVALLINLIDNRANHSFQLRQDLYNLLKGRIIILLRVVPSVLAI